MPDPAPRRTDIYLIGVTGNIATGKSTVDGFLEARGAVVLDADRLVHDLQAKGQPVWRRIQERFGSDLLLPSGELDRAALARVVFDDPAALRDLEAIVHPEVGKEMARWLASVPSGSVAAVDAIKLLESGLALLCDSVWVVICPLEEQLKRLMSRAASTEEDALRRIRAQAPQEEKIRRASIVIDNGGSLEDTEEQVEAAWTATAGAWLSRLNHDGPRATLPGSL